MKTISQLFLDAPSSYLYIFSAGYYSGVGISKAQSLQMAAVLWWSPWDCHVCQVFLNSYFHLREI